MSLKERIQLRVLELRREGYAIEETYAPIGTLDGHIGPVYREGLRLTQVPHLTKATIIIKKMRNGFYESEAIDVE